MIDLPLAISFLAFSAPITAGIIKVIPRKKNGESNGKYVTVREYDSFKFELGDRLNRMEGKFDDLCSYMKSRLP